MDKQSKQTGVRRRREHGEGSIYYDEERDCWYASLRKDGKRKKAKAKSKREAIESLKRLQREADDVGFTATGARTVGEFLREWVEGQRDRLKPRTVVHYDLCVRRMEPFLGTVTFRQLTPLAIERMLRAFRSPDYVSISGEKGALSERSVHHVYAVLRAALRRAKRLGVITINPIEQVDAPRITNKQEMRTLSIEQLHQLMDTASREHLAPLWMVLATTGMRSGEALGLKWSDYDDDAGVLYVRRAVQRKKGEGIIFLSPKTAGSVRRVPVSSLTRRALDEQHANVDTMRAAAGDAWVEHDLIFPSQAGTPLDQGNINARLHRTLLAAGLPSIRVHDLRHTFATLGLSLGIPVNDIQKILGHTSPATTLAIYGHSSLQGMASAAERISELLGRDHRTPEHDTSE